ncbi:hypothetical protein [Nocardia sp. NPDC057353]|uniref:hypothetical protein n=1 Tax=Nocardia sp. NPDC057353 TaxID=3346104 RepID=UPI00363684A5
MTPELFCAAAEVCHTFTPAGGYGLAYGSQAVEPDSSLADLDIVLVGENRPGAAEMSDLVAAVSRIHEDFGLRVDTEVEYETKLFATYADIDHAVGLRCFPRSAGRLRPGPVITEIDWLNSSDFAQRLALNALTSAHLFLGGNVHRYRVDSARAERALILLVSSMLGTEAFGVYDAVQALTHGPDGTQGKDFLGYHRNARLYATVRAGLARLSRPADGTCNNSATNPS